jgi:hypothetical protein
MLAGNWEVKFKLFINFITELKIGGEKCDWREFETIRDRLPRVTAWLSTIDN